MPDYATLAMWGFAPPHPDMYTYAEHCMRRRRHRKVRISRHSHR